jgi:hypothetical protein
LRKHTCRDYEGDLTEKEKLGQIFVKSGLIDEHTLKIVLEETKPFAMEDLLLRIKAVLKKVYG